ncbi:SAM-dependent methyltransferase [Halomarina salina]|uniref:SAM-dependent methyltransferase n=1 Tax=Halomarina salina TaxID=1872699 RepID=A0ABD5RKI2_9EURY|nr:methyltransferase domain-containing protein [Halomarina salina]
MEFDERERRYGREEYYWGTTPNDLAHEAAGYVPDRSPAPTVVDVGAGEGRDAVFFAEQGFEVYATDVSPNGLAKADRLAEERGVSIRTLEADANDLTLPEPVDLLYSCGAVQYVRPENRTEQFAHFRDATRPGGVHVVFAFVDHPDVPTPPDWTDEERFYQPGELRSYYDGWKILDERELVFEDDSDDTPHEHAAEIVVAEKPTTRAHRRVREPVSDTAR